MAVFIDDMKNNVSIVIPTYNERENISTLIPEIFRIFDENNINGNVIIVDDNSPDGTSAEVKRLSINYNIVLISREKKLGIGSAYISGFKEALENSDIIFEMDADFSHNPEDIPKFIEALKNFDVVIGSRYVNGGRIDGWGIYRKAVSWTGNFIAKILLNLGINDATTGYRAYRRRVLEGIDLDSIKSNGYAFQVEILYRASKMGFNIGEVPIIFKNREKGKSKLSRTEIMWFSVMCLGLFIDGLISGFTKE